MKFAMVLQSKKSSFFEVTSLANGDLQFYSPSCIGEEIAKGHFGLLVKLSSVYHTVEALQVPIHTVSLLLSVMHASCKFQFLCSLV